MLGQRRRARPHGSAALELVAEVCLEPTFPAVEVERLRDERLNDLLQARADPRRRAEEAFVGTIYAGASPYRRPSGGTRETVEHLDRDDLREHLRACPDPARMTLVVGGDLGGFDVVAPRSGCSGRWPAAGGRRRRAPSSTPARATGGVVHVVHRPGSVQTEIRVGHRGCRAGSRTSTPSRS